MNANRMPLEEWMKLWMKLWMYMILGCLVAPPSPAGTARPRFDTSTDMGLVLVPADAEIDSVIFRLRATDQDADFPLVFDITATVTPVVRIENLPCTLYNKVCQANVILTRRLIPGRLHDFAVRVKDSKGDSNSMQATISVTNATTQRDKIFPHIPAIIMVPEDTKPGKELDYVLVRSNQWSGKPVYIELWQPKELFTIRQRQTPAETRGVITLIGELDFETQSMYTLTMYATDPYTEPKKDTRNIAGLHLVVIVQDVQDVPPIFTLAPPLTKINNTVQPGDVILRVHAEDGDKGVPREVTYGLVSEGNPFTPFFNISETTGEIILARSLEELTQITHVGAPVVLSVVAEEIRKSTSEPPAQATVVKVGLLLGEPGNSPPFFENDNYVAWIDENAEPGSVITFAEHYSAKVRDEDIGKAGVFALKLENNNGTFEISPAVAERTADFIITVRDNSLIDYETFKSLRFKIIAQEVGPATNLSAIVPATIFIRDVNDNPPEFDAPSYEVTLSEDVTAGTRVIQVHATDKDTGSFGKIQYTKIFGPGNEALAIDPDTGIITVAIGNSILDREITASLRLTVEARDDDGKGLRGIVPLIVNLLDVNDNAPIFERESYEFTLNEDSTNFTMPAIIKAFDADAESPNNEIRYEIVHGNYENKFYLNEITGEIFLREPINKVRRTRHNPYEKFAAKFHNGFVRVQKTFENIFPSTTVTPDVTQSTENFTGDYKMENATLDEKMGTLKIRKKREKDDVIFTLTARAYDLGVPHLSGATQVNVMKGPVAGARIVSFVVPGENPDPVKTAETLAAITGGRITVKEIRPYTIKDAPNGSGTNVPSLEGGKKSIVVASVEPNSGESSLVDVEKIRAALAANGVGVIGGDMSSMETGSETKPNDNGSPRQNANTNTNTNINVTSVHSEEVTVYKAENRLLFWLLIILGLLMLIALIALIICCICPGCPFYMAPRKRRVHSSETLIARSDGRPKRHLHRKHARLMEASWPGKKQAWSADPTRRNWQFNRRNQKAGGLASLPGDVHVIDHDHEIIDKTASLRLRDGPIMMYSTDQIRRPEEERIYIEDVEGLRGRGYVDMETLRQHDVERGMEMSRQPYVNHDERDNEERTKFVREQHFYRDGNAEVLRLVTRGQIEEGLIGHHQHRPQTLVIEQEQSGAYRNDGKDILLQRFIEDQKMRHASDGQDLHDSFPDIEHRSMESHQRQKEAVNIQAQQQQQQKILLMPERLEDDHRQHIEELGPEVQRLIIDHGSFEKTARFEAKDSQELITGATLLVHAPITKISTEKSKEHSSKQSVNLQHYSIHDLELARQNALLTRLLLERDGREVGGGAMADSASYLETQSLPGQVAIATQTDRTAATQTELPSRSRSDNDESEEDARMRKKLKSKKRHADGEPRRIRTLWMKSPIEEEEIQHEMEKRTNFLRKKMRDVKESRRISLEPEVLREISDSLDENGEPPSAVRKRDDLEDSNSKEESRNEDEGHLEDSSSMELGDGGRIVADKRQARTDDDGRRKSHRGKRENIVEPSFRILEKEMSSLSKKLSKLAGKKMAQYSNGSETDSHERGKTLMTNAKKDGKKVEVPETEKSGKAIGVMKSKRLKSTTKTIVLESGSIKEPTKIREEIVDLKTRQPSKYRKSQTISTGSSDFEEIVEKMKKPSPLITHAEKQRQVPGKSSQVKLKRQIRVEHKETGKSPLLVHPQENAEVKDTSDSASKGSIKSDKCEKDSMRMKRCSPGRIEGKTGPSSSSQSSDNLIEKKSQRKEKPVLDRKSAVESSETVGKRSQEMAKVSSAKSNEKSPVEASVLEIKRQSSTVPELSLKIFPETVEMQKSEMVEKHDERVIDEATTVQKPDSSEESESLDAIEHKVVTIPKEEMMDFLAHEMKDSSQALQSHYHSISEGAKKIEDIVLGSVSMESEEKKMPSILEKETISEAVESKSSEHFEEWADVTTDMSRVKHKIVREKNVDQQSEDGGMFSDNFDSFCGTRVHSKESVDTQAPKDEIFYETLQSESSDEQIAEDKITHVKIKHQKDETVTITDEPAEKSAGPQIIPIEKTPEPQKSPEITHFSAPSSDVPSDNSPKKIISLSPTPVAHESITTETKFEIVPDDSIYKSETKSMKNATMEQTIDASENSTESAKSQDTERLDLKSVDRLASVEGQTERLPIDVSTGPVEPAKSPEIERSELTAMEDDSKSVVGHLQSIENVIDQITIDASKSPTESEKSPEVGDLDLKLVKDHLKSVEDHLKSVDDVLQSTEGQIDKLTIDAAKGPMESAESPEIAQLDLKPIEDNLKSVEDHLQSVDGQVGQSAIDTSKGPMEAAKSPEIEGLHLTTMEDNLKSVEGHLQSIEGKIDQLTTNDAKSLIESPKSSEIAQLVLKPVEDGLKSVQDVLQSAESRIDQFTIDGSKDPMEQAKSSKIETLDLKPVEDHSKSVEEQIDQIPIVPPLDIKISDEKIAIIEEPSKPMPEIKSPRLASPSHEEMMLEEPSQKEFGIADSLFIDAKFLTVHSGTEKMVDQKNVEGSQEKILEEEKIEINVPPVNLIELSHAMLDDGDDSDSSEASSKTMLTARPYGTPRHRRISGSEDNKTLEVGKEKTMSFETAKHSEMEEVSIEIIPATGDADESAKSPEKVDKVDLPDETAKEIKPKTPEFHTEVTPSTSGLIVEKSAQDEPNKDLSSVEISSEAPRKEREMPMQDREENVEKLEIAEREEDTKDTTTEKVQQLYQIQQEILPADADGFASLPETNEPIKNLEDSTKLPDETPLAEETKTLEVEIMKEADDDHSVTKSETGAEFLPPAGKETTKLPVEMMKETVDDHGLTGSDLGAKFVPPAGKEMEKLPVEIMKEAVDDHGLKESHTGAKFVPPAEKETTKLPVEKMKETVDDHGLKESHTGAKFVPPAGKETKKVPVETMKKAVDEHGRKELETGAKSVPPTGKESKGIVRKRDPSKEEAPRGARKVLTASTKTPLPKKEPKVRTLKEESSKIAKQTAVVEKLARSRDSKRQARPTQPKMEEVADTLSRTDRARRTWRKTDRPDKDVQQEERAKTDGMRKILPSREDEKSVGKRPSETRAKREKLKESRVKKIPEKTEKMRIKKSIPVKKGEESVQLEEIDQHETIKDLEVFGKKDSEEIHQRETVKDVDDHGEKNVEGIVDSSREHMEMPSIDRNNESITPSPVRIPAKLEDGDKKISEENASLEESTELSTETKVEVPSLIEEKVETRKIEQLPEEIGEKDSALAKEIVESVALNESAEILNEPSASEITEQDMKMVNVPTDKGESEIVALQPEAKMEEKQHDDEDKTRETIEDKSPAVTSEKTSSPRKAGKLRKEAEMVVVESQSRYMEWYKLKREEMERKRQERKANDEEEDRPKWLRKSTRQRWFRGGPDESKIFDPKMAEITPSKRKKIKPLVNVESEQLRAIVRQGRKLRKAQGEIGDEPQIQIFAPEKPPTPLSSIPTSSRYHHQHHLVQHSEYKYEKMPLPPFYLHPPPVPHTSPQMSPHNFEDLHPEQYSSLPTDSRCSSERYESGKVHQQQQGGNKLRHGQLLEKKSVFDIAYSEAAPSQLRSDSTTPPS